MPGIVSYGAYIPIYRLSNSTISSTWGIPLGKGEKAVTNADEDSITMAVEAVIDCLNGTDRSSVDGLYFASTTFPYKEKQSASIVRAAADLRDDIPTIDFANSLRGASNAITAALNAVKAGEADRLMVVASDCRLPAPCSPLEPVFGDGAAAFLIGDSEVAVEVEGSHTVSSEFYDVWRKDGDRYPVYTDDRFTREEGYQKFIPRAAKEIISKYGLTPGDFTMAVYYAPDPRLHSALAKAMGFDVKTQVQDPLFSVLGNTGCAFAPMMLVAALEKAKAGDRILFITYGDGVDAYVLRVTEHIEKLRDRRGIQRHLDSKLMLPTYGQYLLMRNLIEQEADARPKRPSSIPIVWRGHKMVYALYGQKCRNCGQVQFPTQRICMYCQARDNFEDVRLSDKRGRVFTYSKDDRAMEIVLPLVRAIVDLDGGGRIQGQLTDRDEEKVEVGMECEPTFRRILDGSIEGAGFHNYFWKVRPVRC